jgi:hypothetical protein
MQSRYTEVMVELSHLSFYTKGLIRDRPMVYEPIIMNLNKYVQLFIIVRFLRP